MDNIESQVQKLVEQIRPAVQMDGGDVEFVRYDAATETVVVRMGGACQGCAMSEITLKQGIESMIKDQLPQIKEVVTENEI